MTHFTFSVHIQSETQWQALAGALAPGLEAGEVWALQGPMGAGKTTFVQALARALGVIQPVTSPTFGLLHYYPEARLPLVHVDCYRLEDGLPVSTALPELEEFLQRGETLLCIEWPERCPDLETDVTTKLRFSLHAEAGRVLKVASPPPTQALWLQALQQAGLQKA